MKHKSDITSHYPITVLCLVAHYLPGFKAGGPLRSISALVNASVDFINFKIFTADRDETDLVPFNNVNLGEWNSISNSSVFYSSDGFIKFLYQLLKVMIFRNYSILYLNSFFNFKYSILPLFLCKFIIHKKCRILIAPRGEFSIGALALKSQKKNLFIYFVTLLGVYKNVMWHASSILEKNDIQNALGINSNIYIASDLVDKSISFVDDQPILSSANKFTIVFISRISEKKNLHWLLELLSLSNIPLSLAIYGPITDDSYWRKCLFLIKCLPPHIEAIYFGEIHHNEIFHTFAKYNLFVFPTLGENFGHVIIECLQSGTPVIVSDQTPWDSSLGLEISVIELIKPNLWLDLIYKHSSLTLSERSQLSLDCKMYAHQFLKNSMHLNDNLNMFFKISDQSFLEEAS